MICTDNLSPEELAVLGNAIAITIAQGKSADEINVLGNLIVDIGSILLTIAAQKQRLESLQQKKQQQNNQQGNNQQQNNQQQNNQQGNNQQQDNQEQIRK